MALRRFGYHLASQSRAATRSRVPTAMAKAHKFSASQVAVFPNVLKSQETIEQMIPGRLGDPHDVDWLIINRPQGALYLFCSLTCAVGYVGEVLEFDVIKVAREGFIRLLECLYSGAT